MRRAALTLALGLSVFVQIPDQDRRSTDIRHTNTHFTMASYPSREVWLERARFLRKQILSAAGLLPLPEKGPVRAEVFGTLERDGYSIEKVLLETYRGVWLGGNLYRPRGTRGPFPAVVSPHGHWSYGRLENTDIASIPALGINLARQGFVVFTYDMVGYNDTTELPHARLGGDREDLWSINLLGLQLWNSICAVDFVASLPDVDPSRIGATGASGGGTQTFLLTAADDRVKAAASVNMISAIMQGGCDCENAPNLRVRTHNMEIGALATPRPLLMVAATGDWTRNTPREEYPAVRSVYQLLGAETSLESIQIDAPHNYNRQSREAVYGFFGTRLLDAKKPAPEQPYNVEQIGDMLALYGRGRPEGAIAVQQYIEDRIADANRVVERDRSPEACRERLTFSILASKPAAADILSERRDKLPRGERLLLGRKNEGDRIPAVWLEPRRANVAAPATLIVHPEGTAWVLRSSESVNGLVKQMLARGGAVLGIDAFQTGFARAPRDRSKGFFTTFNQTDDANRIQDILTALEYLRSRTGRTEVNLLGLEMGGVWSLFARALADDKVNLAADLSQFRASTDSEYIEKFFIPGIRRAGDFRAAARLVDSGETLLHNASREFPRARQDRVADAELVAWLVPEPKARPRKVDRD
jgi:dienelactone hydrolase